MFLIYRVLQLHIDIECVVIGWPHFKSTFQRSLGVKRCSTTIHPLHNIINLNTSVLQQWTKNKFSTEINYCQLQHFQLNQNFAVLQWMFPANVLHFDPYPAATVILHSTICCFVSGIQTGLHATPDRNIWQASVKWPCLPCYRYTSSCPSYLELSVQVIHNLCKSGNDPPCSIHICILAARSASPKYGDRSFFLVNSCHKQLLNSSQENEVHVSSVLLLNTGYLPKTMVDITLYYYMWTAGQVE